jgi:hypothetical protein
MRVMGVNRRRVSADGEWLVPAAFFFIIVRSFHGCTISCVKFSYLHVARVARLYGNGFDCSCWVYLDQPQWCAGSSKILSELRIDVRRLQCMESAAVPSVRILCLHAFWFYLTILLLGPTTACKKANQLIEPHLMSDCMHRFPAVYRTGSNGRERMLRIAFDAHCGWSYGPVTGAGN